MKALGVVVTTEQRQGELTMSPGCAVTEVFVTGRPTSIQLRIRSEEKGETTPLVIFEGRPHEYSGPIDFTLTVPVRWEETRGRWIPQTRQRGVDNADAILLDNTTIRFTDIQVALVTRHERFFITAQRVFEGWVRVVEGNVRFIASNPVHAYPGMDYGATWQGMGQVLGSIGRVADALTHSLGGLLENAEEAKWKPAVLPNLNTWERGTVLFFNPITNNGRVRGIDGAEYFVGPNALSEVEGPVKLLAPMKGVYFRPGQPQEGQRYVSVRAVKTA